MTPEREAALRETVASPPKTVHGSFAEDAYRTFRELLTEIDRLREALREYADHQSWRCQYRNRYDECQCGLDETMVSLGLDPVPVTDPEATTP